MKARGIDLIAPNLRTRTNRYQDGRKLRRYRRHWIVERTKAWEPAKGFGERDGALAMLDQHAVVREGTTLGADAGYDVAAFVATVREPGITPHIAQTC